MNATSTLPVPTVDSVIEAAKRLSRDERVELFDRFTEVLGDDEDDAGAVLSPEWIAEIERRSAEIDAGEVELIPAEQVFAQIRASVGDPK